MNKITAAILLMSMLFIPAPLHGKKVKTSLKVEKRSRSKKETAAKASQQFEGIPVEILPDGYAVMANGEAKDTITWLQPSDIVIAGYDKPANASRESIHLINSSSHTIQAIRLNITYSDMQGRMLHRRTVTSQCMVPGGETRKIDFPTWDSQKSYYYYLGQEPKKIATPYSVAIDMTGLWIK